METKAIFQQHLCAMASQIVLTLKERRTTGHTHTVGESHLGQTND